MSGLVLYEGSFRTKSIDPHNPQELEIFLKFTSTQPYALLYHGYWTQVKLFLFGVYLHISFKSEFEFSLQLESTVSTENRLAS